MACDIGRGCSRGSAGNCDGSNARYSTCLRRDCAVVVYGFRESILSGVVERADSVVDGADLQLRDLTVRRMARAGVGGDARVDDVGVGDQHQRAVPDAEEVLRQDFAG